MNNKDIEMIQVLLDLYNKEKEKNKDLINGQIDFWLSDKEIEERIKHNYISKDKTREKIKEKKEYAERYISGVDIEEGQAMYKILEELEQELLEE